MLIVLIEDLGWIYELVQTLGMFSLIDGEGREL